MSTTTLRVRHAPGFRVNAARLLPAALAALPVADVARIALPAGNETCAAADLFDIARADSEHTALVIEGEAQHLRRAGQPRPRIFEVRVVAAREAAHGHRLREVHDAFAVDDEALGPRDRLEPRRGRRLRRAARAGAEPERRDQDPTSDAPPRPRAPHGPNPGAGRP